MSRSIDRHRMRKRFKNDLAIGDDNVDLAINAGSELLQMGGKLYDSRQKQQALAQASKDYSDAKLAVAKADAIEKDPNGPLHVAAKQQLAVAQAKLSALTGDSGAQPQKQPKQSSGSSSALKTAAIVGGVGLAGLLAFKLIRRK